MRKAVFGVSLVAVLAGAAPAQQSPQQPSGAAVLAVLRNADLELATIGYRLTTANVALCERVQPDVGLTLQAITQYDPAARADARAAFGFESAVAVEAVVPGGPAERAGVRAGDSLLAIDRVPQPVLTDASATVSSRDRDTALVVLRRASLDHPMPLRILRGGKTLDIVVTPAHACASEFEVLLGAGLVAHSDGARVQIGGEYFDRFDADAIAVVTAHELAHDILGHYQRLRGCGTLKLTRASEDAADRLSVYLLANAGYDATSPTHFWQRYGAALDRGRSHDASHAPAAERASALAAVAAALPQTRPAMPPDFAAMAGRDGAPPCAR